MAENVKWHDTTKMFRVYVADPVKGLSQKHIYHHSFRYLEHGHRNAKKTYD